jgi:endo-1,4-beta-xylanase
VLGKSYIDVALSAARQYAPAGTKLFINDYSTTDTNKLACLVQVVRDLRSRGIPIDGVGHEMHNSINYPSPQAIANAVDTLHENFRDLEQQITEFDLSVYNAGDIKTDYGSAIPPAVLAEQGWLYERTFSLFRRLAGKISAVTIWGMADDDTWLDGFPVTRTDYPLPFDMSLQAKPAYWGVVDAKMLPGYGLKFSSSVTGTGKTYTITLTATNGDVGPAYTTLINSITLQHVEFRRSACTATVVPPSTFPVSLGDIPVSGTASASFNVTLSGCDGEGIWVVEVPWSSATYHTGTYIFITELGHDRGRDSDGDHH